MYIHTKLVVVKHAGAYSDYGTQKVHRLSRSIGGDRWIIVDISSWKHWYGHNPIVIWRNMPARTCDGRNISPRYQLLMDSLAPGNSRTGNHQLPPQIHIRENTKMLFKAVLRPSAGKSEACRYRWGRRRHASVFKPGFVTFVGKREPGVWSIETLRGWWWWFFVLIDNFETNQILTTLSSIWIKPFSFSTTIINKYLLYWDFRIRWNIRIRWI